MLPEPFAGKSAADGQLAGEQPLYALPKKVSRAVVPKIASYLILGTLFYLGVLANVALLELTAPQKTAIKLSALSILLVLIALGTYDAFRRSRQPYLFYSTGIRFGRKFAPYSSLASPVLKRSLLDRIFKTYSLSAGGGFSLRHIPEEVPAGQLQEYLQKLIARYKNQGGE